MDYPADVNETEEARIRRIIREELGKMLASFADVANEEERRSDDTIELVAFRAIEKVAEDTAVRLACSHPRISTFRRRHCADCGEPFPENPIPEDPFEN